MKKFLGVLLACAVLAAGAAIWGFAQYRRFLNTAISPPGGRASLEVKPGTSLAALGRQLDEAGVIEDVSLPGVGSLFYLWAHRVERAGAEIKSGEFLFENSATPEEVLDVVRQGAVRTYRVTIPEGLRLDEAMPLFERAGLGHAQELLDLARSPAFAKSLGIEGESLEGYVFPDTYTFARGLPAKKLLATTVQRFDDAYTKANIRRQPWVKLSRHEVATLGSIIEKETGAAAERPQIGCVFHNRLQRGMKLQTDPTVIYAKILRHNFVWDGKITKSDLLYDHPYNTYTTKGLPPGPIASAGQAALEAAVNPVSCKYLFFVSKNDGTHSFCADYDCHLRGVNKWQRGG